VRLGSRTKVSVPFVLPQNRHPERSALQTYRLTEDLRRGVEEPVPSVAEGTPRMLNRRMLFRAFRPLKTTEKINKVTASDRRAA
jgi:hypothetical protein